MENFSLRPRWWRFDVYEIRDGFIAPVAGAKLTEYDPWGRIPGVANQDRAAPPPHESLLQLLPTLDFAPPASALEPGTQQLQLKPDSQQRVLDWCAQYGLLGVLLQRVEEVTYPYRWRRQQHVSASLAPRLRDGDLYIQQRRFRRTIVGWKRIARPTLDMASVEGPAEEGQVVDPQYLPRELPLPGVTITDLELDNDDLPTPRWEPLSTTWSRYFPSVPEGERDTFPYPEPAEEEFWRLYAEPVDDFVKAAMLLQGVLKLVIAERGLSSPSASEEELGHYALEQIRKTYSLQLLRLGTDSRPAVGRAGEVREVPVFASLLGAMGLRVTKDLATGKWQILTCRHCGAYFLSTAYQARYCSKRCQRAEGKAKLRAKRAAASQDSSK